MITKERLADIRKHIDLGCGMVDDGGCEVISVEELLDTIETLLHENEELKKDLRDIPEQCNRLNAENNKLQRVAEAAQEVHDDVFRVLIDTDQYHENLMKLREALQALAKPNNDLRGKVEDDFERGPLDSEDM